MKENSIEKDEEILNNIKAYMQENIDKGYHKFVYNDLGYDEKCVDVINAIEHILSDYKRVLKENERISSENGIGKRQYEELVDDYEKLNLENIELKKENEELKQDRNNNNEMVALARNEVLNYMTGYEDGKKHKMTATAQVVENQQYYIIQKQMEKYEEHIKRLKKENEKLKNKLLDTLKGQKVIKEETPQYIKENYISKEKTKDKIEALKNNPIKIKQNDKYYFETDAYNKIIQQVLQELLEGRK